MGVRRRELRVLRIARVVIGASCVVVWRVSRLYHAFVVRHCAVTRNLISLFCESTFVRAAVFDAEEILITCATLRRSQRRA